MKKLTFLCFILFIAVSANAQITVSSGNNVGIKTSTPNEALEVNGNIRGNLNGGALQVNTSSNGYIQLGPQNNTACHIYTDRPYFGFNKTVVSVNGDFGSYFNNDLIFKTNVSYNLPNGNVRITIKNTNGYVGILNTNPSCALDVTGVIKSNGVLVTSDERLKDNVKNVNGALASLNNLQGVTYKFKANLFNPTATPAPLTAATNAAAKTDSSTHVPIVNAGDTTFLNRTHIGFLAQDIQKVFPNLVYADKDGMLSVDYISLIPVLVESMKELSAKVQVLADENKLLKAKLGIK